MSEKNMVELGIALLGLVLTGLGVTANRDTKLCMKFTNVIAGLGLVVAAFIFIIVFGMDEENKKWLLDGGSKAIGDKHSAQMARNMILPALIILIGSICIWGIFAFICHTIDQSKKEKNNQLIEGKDN